MSTLTAREGHLDGPLEFDEITAGLHLRRLILVAARTATGETAKALKIAQQAVREPHPCPMAGGGFGVCVAEWRQFCELSRPQPSQRAASP